MNVSKGPLYFQGRLSTSGDSESLISAMIELMQELPKSTDVEELIVVAASQLANYGELFFDVLWAFYHLYQLQSDEEHLMLVASLLRATFLDITDPNIRKLAISRLDPELLEPAGIVASSGALVKKTSRINTQVHYKFNKRLFLTSSDLILKPTSMKDFFWQLGQGEWDVHRLIEATLSCNSLLIASFIPSSILVDRYFNVKLDLLWRMQRALGGTKLLSDTDNLFFDQQYNNLSTQCHLLNIQCSQLVTHPLNPEEARTEYDQLITNLKTVQCPSPFPEVINTWNRFIISPIRNQRIYFLNSNPSLLNEEPYLRELAPIQDPQPEAFTGKMTLLERCQFITLTGGSVFLHDLLWKDLTSQLSINDRKLLYRQWDLSSDTDLRLSFSIKLSKSALKKLFRRLSSENVRQYGRLLGKISKGAPVRVLKYVIEQALIYDNLILPVIECVRYLTPLEFDIFTTYCLTLPSGMHLSSSNKASMNLAFLGARFFKRHLGRGSFEAYLQFIHDEIVVKLNPQAVMLLMSLMEELAALESPDSISDHKLLLLMTSKECVGPHLWKHVFMDDNKNNASIDESSQFLWQHLKPYYEALMKGLRSLQSQLLLTGTDDIPLKVALDLADRCTFCRLQLLQLANKYNPELIEESDQWPSVDLSDIYSHEINLLTLSSSTTSDRKLKAKLFEEECKSLPKALASNCITWESAMKLSIRSITHAWQAAQNLDWTLFNTDDLLNTLQNMLPLLTSWEAHNFGRFVQKILLHIEQTSEQDKDKDTQKVEEVETAVSMEQIVPMPIKITGMTMEEGEMTPIPENKLRTFHRQFTDHLLSIGNEMTEGEEEFVRRRNILILIWRCKPVYPKFVTDIDCLRMFVQACQEKDDDLKVLAKRVESIFYGTDTSMTMAMDSPITSAVMEASKETPIIMKDSSSAISSLNASVADLQVAEQLPKVDETKPIVEEGKKERKHRRDDEVKEDEREVKKIVTSPSKRSKTDDRPPVSRHDIGDKRMTTASTTTTTSSYHNPHPHHSHYHHQRHDRAYYTEDQQNRHQGRRSPTSSSSYSTTNPQKKSSNRNATAAASHGQGQQSSPSTTTAPSSSSSYVPGGGSSSSRWRK